LYGSVTITTLLSLVRLHVAIETKSMSFTNALRPYTILVWGLLCVMTLWNTEASCLVVRRSKFHAAAAACLELAFKVALPQYQVTPFMSTCDLA
jgi:hypothetical protein